MSRVLAALALTATACAAPAHTAEWIVATPIVTPVETPMSVEAAEVTHEAVTPVPVVRAEPPPAAAAANSAAPGPSGRGELLRMSWYSMGTRTANGERVDPDQPNCAGASRWPFGIRLTLRNPENNRVIAVRINDRGGFEKLGRALDCMKSVWHALGIPLSRGVATVEVLA